MGKRSKGREYALLSLFPYFVTGEDCYEVYQFLLDERDPSQEVKDFSKALIDGVMANVEELDQIIKESLTNWSMDRVGNLEKTILRIGAYEMKYTPETALSIIIHEANDLTDTYSVDESLSFVSGVLNGIAKKLRPED
ncbi:MAG: transcription antitermination factor NusB [Candidatus Cloacimonetes bacterium]|nr:transcription antitermination factor NusB [Candidatus Cloacimonadota bacterium]